MALLFRVVESAIGAVGAVGAFAVLQLNLAVNYASAFDTNQLGALADLRSGVGTNVSAIFFGLGSSIFFVVFLRSRYIPRILAAWGVFGSALYAAVWFVHLVLPQYSTPITVGSIPILIAELSTGLWLLIAGIRLQPARLGGVDRIQAIGGLL